MDAENDHRSGAIQAGSKKLGSENNFLQRGRVIARDHFRKQVEAKGGEQCCDIRSATLESH